MAKYAYDAWGKCTIVEDTSERGIATITPFRYRGYYYDPEIGMYYLQSRYYDPNVGRFLNADNAEILGVSLLGGYFTGTTLFSYCENEPVNTKDIFGGLSDKQLANLLSPALIFSMFMAALCANLSKGLLQVSGHVTKIIAPVAVKTLWWKPALAAALIVAAVALVVAGVLLIYNAHIKAHEKTITKADAKIKATVTRGSKVRYWSATLRKDHVDLGRALTYSQAVYEVSAGRNVFAVTWYEAKAVAIAAGGNTGHNNKTLSAEIHGDGKKGYYWHYHTYNRKGGHVYYLF